MADNEALQDSEQDFSIPGQDEADEGGIMGVPQQGAPPPSPQQQQAQAAQTQPQPQQAAPAPRISGKAQFFGNLLKTLLTTVQNTQGNPNNAFDRGFHNASPQVQQEQQANLSKVQSEADLAKMQVSLTGMKALQYEYLLKRLPAELQEQHMKVVSEFKQNLIKEGASVEAEAADEKAADGQATYLNGSDPRSTGHAGKFYSLPTMDTDGKPKFDVVYVPNKDTLQNDFKWEDSEGNEHSIAAGTPFSGALGKFVELQQKDAQSQTKNEHKMMADALKPNVPDAQIPQTVAWLQNQQKQNTPLYQQNKNAADAQINVLQSAHGMIQKDKLDQARAGAQMRSDIKQDELTSSTKTMTEAAPRVVDFVDKINKLIDENESGLGPSASRWKEFKAGKIGLGDAAFTKLRTDVGLLTTLLMRMHVGARGGEYIMKHFQDLIDSSKQSPENLRAALGEIRSYAQDVAKDGGKGGQSSSSIDADLGKPVYVQGKLVGHTKDGKTMTPVQ